MKVSLMVVKHKNEHERAGSVIQFQVFAMVIRSSGLDFVGVSE
jgi:hypothetical protein